jgi:hypothetical protein
MHRSSSMHTGLRSNRISIIPFSLLVSSFPSLQFQHMTIFRNPLTMETHFFDFMEWLRRKRRICIRKASGTDQPGSFCHAGTIPEEPTKGYWCSSFQMLWG